MGGFERQGQGRGSPLLIALIIAVVGFFMYLTQTETNPVTGVKQHISLSPEQEIRLGLQAAPTMIAHMGGKIPSSDPRAQEVQKIGQQIASRTTAHKGPWRYQYHVLADSKTVNAFALPGGQIFITLALLNRLQTEAQLAGVLAHETGHVIERHSAEQMAKNQLGQILVLATGVGASDSTHSGRAQQAAAVASIVNQVTQLRYSRKDELEADEWGLRLMTEAGYDPKAMLEVMQILEKAAPGGHTPEILLTHPYPEHRIQHIKAYLEKHPPSSHLTEGRKLKDLFGDSASYSKE